MPHLTIEYSANLDGRIDIGQLCSLALSAACSTGMLEQAATRVRAIRCENYAIADEHPDNGFVDCSLRIGQGRTQELKKATGQALWDALRNFCQPLYEGEHFALSVEIREIDKELSWKENGMKKRAMAALGQ